MPLLKKKSLETTSSHEHFRDDEEVFYCEITNEIFRNYEEFAERMLLCTSMVWTCEMTGKTNLTYEEALESEEVAKKIIQEFPNELKIPILYVASKTKCTTFSELSEEVFHYCKDRYFINEKVEASFTSNKWVESHVLQVLPPTPEEIKKASPKNGSHPNPPHSLYKYEIEHLDADDEDISEIMIVDYNQIRRKKSIFTREKCRLFLKQFMEQDDNMHWVVKKSTIKEYNLDKMDFETIFAGPQPNFDPSKNFGKKINNVTSNSPLKQVNSGKKTKQETISKYLTKHNNGENKMNGNVKKSNDLVEQMEKKKKEFEELKRKKEEEKLEQKKLEKVEQTLITNQLKEWWKPKEDLELENQQALPEFPEIQTRIPNEYLGDVLMVMEFMTSFKKLLKTKNFFNSGVTLEVMERALLEQEVAGPLVDLIQMLLTALFHEEDEEYKEYNTSTAKPTFLRQIKVNETMSLEDGARLATLAAKWPKDRQGISLRKLPLYSLNVTEILRLHLLASGAKLNEPGEKGRFTHRGGYSNTDDPGLHLRLKQPHILRALAIKNVVQLPICDKLSILSCLIDQLLTFASFRDAIEDRIEQSRQLKMDIRNAQISDRKKENEYNAAVLALKKEAKKTNQDPKMTENALEKLRIADEKRKVESEKLIESYMKTAHDSEIVLGMDRAFRKYYKLESIPGVLIDSYEDHPGVCSTETVKQYPELIKPEGDKIIKAHLRKLLDSTKKSPKKMNGDSVTSTTSTNYDELLMCTGDKETCTIHGPNRNVNWKFLSDSELLDNLIDTLNKRGLRENELSQILQNDKETLIKFIKRTPVHQLNSKLESMPEEESKLRILTRGKKNYLDPNFNFPEGTPVETILESTMIDEILEMEEKIYTGGLGQLQVKDRKLWRKSLSNRQYENFEREIVRIKYEKKIDHAINGGEQNNDDDLVEEEEDDEENVPHDDAKKKYSDFDPGTFVLDTNEIALSKDTRNAIECLSIALVQLAYSVEPKFLQKPLGDSTGRSLATYVPIKNRLDKWEKSLLESTSFNQIFLHFSTLDACVMWSRSTMLAKCRICRSQKDSKNMLLCDSCNLGHHLYCLKPKLKSIPKGDWFCSKCTTAKEAEQRNTRSSEVLPKKKRRLFKQETELEEDDLGDEEEPEEIEQTKNNVAKKRKIENENGTNGKVENGTDEEEDDEEEEYSSDAFDDDFSGNLCGSCNSGGFLITCEECHTCYHKECADPPPKSNRSVLMWVCSDCNQDDEFKIATGNNDNHRNGRNKRRNRKKEKRQRRSGRTVPTGNKESDENEDSSDSDEYPLSHHLNVNGNMMGGVVNNGRRSAAKARHNIYNFIKSLRRLSSSSGNDDNESEDDVDQDEIHNSIEKRKRSLRRESGRDDLPLHNAALQDLLSDIMKNANAWPFLKPVQKNEVPDYYEVIKHPMDFGTIKYKLNMGEYSMDSQLMYDVMLVFENCKIYNNADTEVYRCGERLLGIFRAKCAELGLKMPKRSKELLDDDSVKDEETSNKRKKMK